MLSPMTNVSTITITMERKIKLLRITVAITILSFITFLITLTSSQWIIITYPHNFFAARQKMFVVKSTYGIIWECLFGRTQLNSAYGEC